MQIFFSPIMDRDMSLVTRDHVSSGYSELIHWGWVAHIYGSVKLPAWVQIYKGLLLGQHQAIIGSDLERLVAWSAPSHYLNQCGNIVNLTHRNKLKWNIDQNSYIFNQGNAFEIGVCKMLAILFRPQCLTLWGLIMLYTSVEYWINIDLCN